MSNPFRPTRFEWHKKPLIWVSPLARQILADEGPVYLAGARGSGKTSILKVLDSVEQLTNPTLAAQLDLKNIDCFGIYFRASDVFTQGSRGLQWKNFAPKSIDPELIEVGFVSALFELTAGRILLKTLSLLRRNRRIRHTHAEATGAARSILLECLRSKSNEVDGSADPLLQVANIFKRRVEDAYAALVRGDTDKLFECIELGQPGSLLAGCAEVLLPLAKPPQFRKGDIRLKVCVDECDYLIPSQQTILNSLVRRSATPIEWTLAYVDAEFDATSTIFPTQNLTDSDRKVIPLDESTKPQDISDFRRRCQAIASYRLFYNLPESKQSQVRAELRERPIDELFNLAEHFPEAEVNELLDSSLSPRESVSRNVSQFIDSAIQFRKTVLELGENTKGPKSEFVRHIIGKRRAPYYQFFLIQRLAIQLADHSRNPKKRDALAALLRRKEIAAMLMILRDLHIREIPYAGYPVILALSDGCIRDFLELMASIYELWRIDNRKGADPLSFIKSRNMPLEVQRKGILQASNEKFRGIAQSRLARDNVTGRDVVIVFSRVISALGKLTRKLQVSDHGDLSLHTAERGIFVVNPIVVGEIEGRRRKPIGSSLNLLRKLDSENLSVAGDRRLGGARKHTAFNPYRFRLHKRFSPMFGLSYRGALEEVRLPDELLVDLVFANSEFAEDRWVEDALRRIGALQNQADLFKGE